MGVLCQILRSFHFRDKSNFLKLYKTYVRPHLEFSAPVWSPWLQKDIDILERVQRKFTKNVSGLGGKPYDQRLIELELLSLEDRRRYLAIVETFKMLNGYTNVDYRELFDLNRDVTRRVTRAADCPMDIVVKRSHLDIRKNFYTNSIAPIWNGLPIDLKLMTKLEMFKAHLKTHLISNRLVTTNA